MYLHRAAYVCTERAGRSYTVGEAMKVRKLCPRTLQHILDGCCQHRSGVPSDQLMNPIDQNLTNMFGCVQTCASELVTNTKSARNRANKVANESYDHALSFCTVETCGEWGAARCWVVVSATSFDWTRRPSRTPLGGRVESDEIFRRA